MRPTYFLVDKKNKYLPYWGGGISFFSFSSKFMSVASTHAIGWIFSIGFWAILYFKRIFKHRSSIIIGFITSIVLMILYNMFTIIPISLNGDLNKDKWVLANNPEYDFLVDNLNKYVQIDKERYGIFVDKEFLVSKNIDYTRISDYFRHVLKKKITPDEIEDISESVKIQTADISYCGYVLLTLLFTIGILTYDLNQKIFSETVFPIFKIGVMLATLSTLTWVTLYDFNFFLAFSFMKIISLMNAISLTIALIVELSNTYMK